MVREGISTHEKPADAVLRVAIERQQRGRNVDGIVPEKFGTFADVSKFLVEVLAYKLLKEGTHMPNPKVFKKHHSLFTVLRAEDGNLVLGSVSLFYF